LVKKTNRLNEPRQKIMWVFLPIVLTVSLLFPPAGIIMVSCMAGAVIISVFKGRAWCDWMCPRGSFFDYILSRFSSGKKVPSWVRSEWFRAIVMLLVMGIMFTQIVRNWGDLYGIGRAFTLMLLVTTAVGLIFGIFVDSRIWCHVCPMGTLAGWIGRYRKPVAVFNNCTGCGICKLVCPMQIDPLKWKDYKGGIVADTDCIRCSSCYRACPKGAIGVVDIKEGKRRRHEKAGVAY